MFAEFIAEHSIAVAQQVTRQLVKGKGLPQLLSRPLCDGVGGHIAVQNATPVMGQYQKHVKYLGFVEKLVNNIQEKHFCGPLQAI